tara:strand:- start:25 stop:348 length:324 start_codon:yes stop_codon:yes gene_type:complete
MSTTGYLQDTTGAYIEKDAGSTLDYTIDWTNWLGTDTVDSVTYTLDSGITTSTAIGGSATSTTSTTTTVNITGGTVGTIYNVKCEMTTANGRVAVRNFRVKVINKQL